LVDALICYKQKCKVASFNLAHPVETMHFNTRTCTHFVMFSLVGHQYLEEIVC